MVSIIVDTYYVKIYNHMYITLYMYILHKIRPLKTPININIRMYTIKRRLTQSAMIKKILLGMLLKPHHSIHLVIRKICHQRTERFSICNSL